MPGKMIRSLSLQQLIGFTFTASVLMLALASSLVISHQAGDTVQRRLQDEGMRLVESLAEQSTLALLYESRDSAADVVRSFRDFPDVAGIELLTADGQRLYANATATATDLIAIPRTDTAALVAETPSHWIYSAPVFSGSEQADSPFAFEEASEPEQIGSVRLTMSKGTLSSMQGEIVESSIMVALLLSAVLLLVLLTITSRLTVPMRKLSDVMRRAQDGESNTRAELEGTREIVKMQQAFNTMMEVLRHREDTISEARDEALDREQALKIARDQAVERGEALKVARDQALESARAKGEFAATVSHELRTPLNGVIGMLDLVAEMEMPRKQGEYVQTARNSADMLLNLINDILAFSKNDAGKTTLEVVEFNLREKCEEVIALIAPQAQAKGLELGCVLDENIPALVMGDVHHLGQVLVNLVGNAVKFTDHGEISIRIQLEESDPQHLVLGFSVNDTGIGIPPEKQRDIFEAFSQADSSTTRQFGGTGLGLAISRQLVQLMGGQLGLASQPGEGSRFLFSLPFIRARETSSQLRATLPLNTPARMLLIDEHPLVAESLKSMLAGEPIHLSTANSISAGLQRLQQLGDQEKPDVVIIEAGLVERAMDLGEQRLFDTLSRCAGNLIRTTSRPRSSVRWPSDLRLALTLDKPLRRQSVLDALRGILLKQTPVPRAVTPNTSEGQRERFDGSRILVVEDNRANQQVAIGMLEKLGCEVTIANDGQEGLDQLAEKPFDLVFMDCNMPRMDGFEATQRIRESNASFSSITVVAMTANVHKSAMEQCEIAGMNDYLAKPIKLRVVRDMLNRWLAPGEAPTVTESIEAGNEEAIMDQAFLDNLRDEIGSAVDTMLQVFLEDLPGYLETLRTASLDADQPTITGIAHTIKGSAANIGAGRLATKARQLENDSRENGPGAYETLVSAVIYEASMVRHILGDHEPTLQQEDRARETGGRLASRQARVLIVEDDRGSRFALRETLMGEGYQVVEASDGQRALEICRMKAPDLVLMDCMMPVMDGFQSCAAIRALPDCTSIPILMITGLNDEQSVDRAFASGATDYVSKPINFGVLRHRVERLLEASKAEAHVRQLAFVDSLTGLPNRTMFNEHLQQMVDQNRDQETQFALLFLDLDNFKIVNDSLGHEAGDLLLKYFSERISNCVRKGDMVSRFGGDEFCVLLDRIKSYDVVTAIAEKLHDHLSRPFVFMGREMLLTSSIGIAVFPDHGQDPGDLLKAADIAMYRAKDSSSSWQVYESHLHSAILQRVELEQDLRNAIDRDQLRLYYQPQQDLRTGRIAGVEALIRWEHPTRGMVSPLEFISLAEDTGLIGDIGHWVLCEACKQMRSWIESGYVAPRIAVNLSAKQLANPALVSTFREVIMDHGLPPDRIEFEITESTIMDKPEDMIDMLHALKAMGARLAIDDFGTGYSSLSYLKRFPIDYIKIDRAFITDVLGNRIDADIVRTILALAKALEVEVIAEGVETEEQREFLREHHCHYAQGYLLSRPVPAEELERQFLLPDANSNLVSFPSRA